MSRIERAVFLVLVLAYLIWRFIRYMKLGMSPRPTRGVPGGAGWIADAPATTDPPIPSPDSPAHKPRAVAILAACVLWLAVNGLVAFALFGVAATRDMPPLISLLVIVLMNFYLLPWCRRFADRRDTR